VLRISLRDVAIRLRKGESFEDALLSTITTQGFSRGGLLDLMNETPLTLVGDGLDETDPDRAIVAAHLRSWTLVDNSRHVIVTTRPVGHDSAWFDGWRHFELLPLAEKDVKQFAHEIYKLLFPTDLSRAEQSAEAFLQDIQKSRTASFAARNPQLLGLLIALHASGTDISGKRYELFDKVTELIRQQKIDDRAYVYELSASTARRALEMIGWQLLMNPSLARKELIRRVGNDLAIETGEPPLSAQETAERGLGFWEERGLLEQLSVAGESASVFIHLTFRDHAAATYLSRLSDEDFVNWVSTAGRSQENHETLVLTGATSKLGVAVETLLEADDVEDPISTSALLAADVLAEAELPPPIVTERVISHLLPRLTSPVPLVAYEAAEKLRPLALACPALIGPVARRISKNEWKWVREVGCALSLLAGDKYVDVDILLAIYPDVSDTRWRSGRPSGIVIDDKPILGDLILKGTEYLLRPDAPPNHIEAVTKKFEDGDFSSGVYDEIWTKLRARKLALKHALLDAATKFDWSAASETTREVSKVVIAATVKACEDLITRNIERRTQPKSCIGKLHNALAVGKNPSHELPRLLDDKNYPALTEVVRGVIAAVGLDPKELKSEAQQVLADLDESPYKLIHLEPTEKLASSSLDWALANGIELNQELLIAAVNSGVACVCINAANLLLYSVEDTITNQAFRKLLKDGSGHALRITTDVAKTLWGSEAVNLILDRLANKLSDDCAPLIEALGSESHDQDTTEKITAVLSKAVQHRSVEVVEAALAAIEKLSLDAILKPAIRVAYDHWLNHGPKGPEKSGRIPENAVGSLLEYLTQHGMLGFEELTEALDVSNSRLRSEVKPIVVRAIAKLMEGDELRAQSVLRDIGAGKLPNQILYSLSKNHPSICKRHEAQIFELLSVDDIDVKIACIYLLGDGALGRNRSEETLQHLIKSDSHTIRDEAVRALRRLANSSSRW